MTKRKKNLSSSVFKAGDERTRESARKGGLATAESWRKASGLEPYRGSILDVMDAIELTGPSWLPWRAFWSAVFALPMDDAQVELYRAHTERADPPAVSVKEAAMPIGRRGGKSRNAAVAALFLAIRFDPARLSPGETGVVMILAPDRKQARTVLNYLKGLCELDEFAPYVHRTLKEVVEFNNGINVVVATASYRTTRGYTLLGVVCDEIAFWSTDDGAANPDTEILGALRPGMSTVEDSLLLMLSSPYATKGELYRAVERSFGREDPRVLVWNSDTASMNPDIDRGVIDQAFVDDATAAASEYGTAGRVHFRTDVQAAFDPAAVRAVVVPGRIELPRKSGVRYVAFADPSGGAQDSFTLAVAHAERDMGVLDCIREIKPPFNPNEAVREFAAVLRSYGITHVVGDRYAAEWNVERWRAHSIEYRTSEKVRSDLYRELLPIVNSRRAELLDDPALFRQLVQLERRTARAGKDSIDHPRRQGARDDIANAVAGALTLLELGNGGYELVFSGMHGRQPAMAVAGDTSLPRGLREPWYGRRRDDSYGVLGPDDVIT